MAPFNSISSRLLFRIRDKKMLVVLSLLISTGLSANAQQSPSTDKARVDALATSREATPIPDYVLYHEFFRHLLYIDRQAANRQSKTFGTKELSNSYQTKLRFNADEFSKVRSFATLTERQVADIDVKARAIIDAFRAEHRSHSPSEPLPSPPVELATLQQQRNALIQNQINNLRANLPTQSATKLDDFLKSQFAPHVRIGFVGTPRVHNPAANPVPPFERSY